MIEMYSLHMHCKVIISLIFCLIDFHFSKINFEHGQMFAAWQCIVLFIRVIAGGVFVWLVDL